MSNDFFLGQHDVLQMFLHSLPMGHNNVSRLSLKLAADLSLSRARALSLSLSGDEQLFVVFPAESVTVLENFSCLDLGRSGANPKPLTLNPKPETRNPKP